MGFNTFPCNPYPISTEELNKGNNDDLNTRVTVLESDVSDLNSNKANQITIAPFFSAETAYEVGDLVYYNGLSYRCTNDHEGEWDADDFAATTISNELNTLKSGLTNLTHWIDEGISQDSVTLSAGFEQIKLYATNSSGGTVWAEVSILGEFLPTVIMVGTMMVTRSGSTLSVTNNPDSLYLKVLSMHA